MSGLEFATVVVVCLTVIIVVGMVAGVQRAAYRLDEKPTRAKVRGDLRGPTGTTFHTEERG